MSYTTQSTGMGTWCTKKIAKKNKGRQETGRSKGIVASALQKYMCRSNRSWKHREYGAIMGIRFEHPLTKGQGEFTRAKGKK